MAAQTKAPFLSITPNPDWLDHLLLLGFFRFLVLYTLLPLLLFRLYNPFLYLSFPLDFMKNVYDVSMCKWLAGLIALWLLSNALQAFILPARKVWLGPRQKLRCFWLSLQDSWPWLWFCLGLLAMPEYAPIHLSGAIGLIIMRFFEGRWVSYFSHQLTLVSDRKSHYLQGLLRWVNWAGKPLVVCWTFYIIFFSSIGTNCGSKISSVKANMHILQMMVENFRVEHGQIPHSLSELKQNALNSFSPYWKEISNPFTSQYTNSKPSPPNPYVLREDPEITSSHYAWKLFGIRLIYAPGPVGVVSYEYHTEQNYAIYGYDHNGQKIRIRGEIFKLTASD